MSKITIILKGMGMGIAEIIPGVSGGTIAFITGIYETLLDSINAIKPSLIKSFKEGGLSQVWKEVNGTFLFYLLIGMGLGIVGGVLTISHLLDHYPNLVWSLFFGIIFASVFYIGSQITKWGLKNILLFVVFAAATIWVTNLQPAGGSDNLLVVFFSGFIAISALMLPGISGSFMLLLMGMYTFIVQEHLKQLIYFEMESLLVIGIFGLGCLVGVFSFARLLQWTFENYRNGTLASLTGILLGSLYKIWPWRNPTSILDKSSGDILYPQTGEIQSLLNDENLKIITEQNVLPDAYYSESQVSLVILIFALGLVSVYLMHHFSKEKL